MTLSGFERVLAIDWHARTNRIVLMTADEENTLWSIWSVTPDGSDQWRLLTGNDYFRAICTSPVADVVYAMRQDQRHDTLELLRVPMYADPRGVRVLQTGLPITPMAYRCTVSADGRRLLYGRGERHAALWQLDPVRATPAPAPLTGSDGNFFHPAVSPDGRWVAATRGSEFDHELVKVPLGGGDPVRIGEGAGPAWSPDGRQLAFTSRRGGSPGVWISGVNGDWAKEVKNPAAGAPRPIWLPDGRLGWQTQPSYGCSRQAARRNESAFPDRAGPAGCDPAARTSSIVCSLIYETSDAWMMQDFDPIFRRRTEHRAPDSE